MGYKRLFNASHWVDPDTGEEVKLTHNFKAVYIHKMDQYKSFTKQGKPYQESHQRVADRIGVSLKVVDEVAIPLLKRMGLIKIDSRSTRIHITTMYDLKFMKGWLINKKLTKERKQEHKKTTAYNDKHTSKLTYEQMKNIEKNKKNMEKIKSRLTEDLVILSKEDFEKLLKRKDYGEV